ncbi:hypothetical protein HPB49_013246 [Dermacentor silvarum]|uniref:Uncharacterized protein n=1 Tax=Dermacentor silvarum TaxID=543639 RepID=A0ACB8E0R9_DERSI|nr:hypothetical protein HPB49_013246 [Dermacentor silvarum]
MYSVPSSSMSMMYEVNIHLGLCSCRAGHQGAFCKHQAKVQKEFGGLFPNSPLLTPHDCQQLAELALGTSCLLVKFFLPMGAAPQDDRPVPCKAQASTIFKMSGQEGAGCALAPEVSEGTILDLHQQPQDLQPKYRALEEELRRLSEEGPWATDAVATSAYAPEIDDQRLRVLWQLRCRHTWVKGGAEGSHPVNLFNGRSSR